MILSGMIDGWFVYPATTSGRLRENRAISFQINGDQLFSLYYREEEGNERVRVPLDLVSNSVVARRLLTGKIREGRKFLTDR